MELEERILKSETRIFKVVFPESTNHHNTMFGGKVLMMMAELAFVTATRFSRKDYVLVSSGQVDFAKPIPAGTLVELVGKVLKVGNKSITLQVDVFLEQMKDDSRVKVVSGSFTFVAIDEAGESIAVLD